MESSPTIWTIGHSNRAIGDFIALLKTNAITMVVDVRKMPGSRKNPQFGGAALADSLAQAGMQYRHMPGLGGLRRPAPDSPNAGWRIRSFQAFADYMLTPEFEKNLESLLHLASGERAALLCAEAVPWRCHRSLIADALVVRGAPVEHILSNHRNQPHLLHSFARVNGQKITYPPEAGSP